MTKNNKIILSLILICLATIIIWYLPKKEFTNYKIKVNILNDQGIKKDTIIFYNNILTYDGGYIRLIKNGKVHSYYTFDYKYVD